MQFRRTAPERTSSRIEEVYGMSRKAIVLLSGGLDSTTVLAIAKNQGFEPYALSFRYGQRHEVELAAAQRVAEAAGVARHVVCDIDLRVFGGSALTADIDVPKHDSADGVTEDEIPITYVPARNTIFLSFALAYAEVVGSTDIFIGVNALDYSATRTAAPSTSPPTRTMANLATRAGVEGNALKIHTPLIDLTKAETVELGTGAWRRLLADVVLLRPGRRRPAVRPLRLLPAAAEGLRGGWHLQTRCSYQEATA